MPDPINLWSDPSITTKAGRPSITPFLLNDGREHAAVLVIPGGGYGCVCESSEGSPVAREFNRLGLHAFVLDYRVAPHRYPEPQLDAMRAVQMIRGRAAEWQVKPDAIAVCGFSAGGHLAASLGTICRNLKTAAGDRFDAISHRPDFLFLSYGVLTFAPWSNQDTQKNLIGEDAPPEMVKACSPADHVGPDTPPAFIWHTFTDQMVNFRNSIVFAEAMQQHHLPCELQMFPYGLHGMLLGIDTPDIRSWSSAAINFMHAVTMSPELRQRIYSNPYQCEKNAMK